MRGVHRFSFANVAAPRFWPGSVAGLLFLMREAAGLRLSAADCEVICICLGSGLFQKLRRVLHGDFAALELLQDAGATRGRSLMAEEHVHEIEPLDHRRVGNAQFLFNVPDFPLTSQEGEHEELQVGRKPEEWRNGKPRLDRGVARHAPEAANLQSGVAERAASDEMLRRGMAHELRL